MSLQNSQEIQVFCEGRADGKAGRAARAFDYSCDVKRLEIYMDGWWTGIARRNRPHAQKAQEMRRAA
jgi:hypothetical protein